MISSTPLKSSIRRHCVTLQEPAKAAIVAPPPAATVTQGDGLVGVPAVPGCRVALRWIGDAEETSGYLLNPKTLSPPLLSRYVPVCVYMRRWTVNSYWPCTEFLGFGGSLRCKESTGRYLRFRSLGSILRMFGLMSSLADADAIQRFCRRQSSGEANGPSGSEMAVRDSEGMYSPEQPFWATVTSARYLTASTSDRKVPPPLQIITSSPQGWAALLSRLQGFRTSRTKTQF